MIHHYVIILTRSDGKSLRKSQKISGQDVARQTNGQLGGMGRGDRLDFLELINRWNKVGLGNNLSGNHYQYIAGDSTRDFSKEQ